MSLLKPNKRFSVSHADRKKRIVDFLKNIIRVRHYFQSKFKKEPEIIFVLHSFFILKLCPFFLCFSFFKIFCLFVLLLLFFLEKKSVHYSVPVNEFDTAMQQTGH